MRIPPTYLLKSTASLLTAVACLSFYVNKLRKKKVCFRNLQTAPELNDERDLILGQHVELPNISKHAQLKYSAAYSFLR